MYPDHPTLGPCTAHPQRAPHRSIEGLSAIPRKRAGQTASLFTLAASPNLCTGGKTLLGEDEADDELVDGFTDTPHLPAAPVHDGAHVTERGAG